MHEPTSRTPGASAGRRTSVHVTGLTHANPVPAASRIGPFVASGAITGRDPLTRQMPTDLDAQCVNLFAHVRAIIEAAGGTTGDILKLTIRLQEYRDRDALNRAWTAMFPDPDDRPARHVLAAELDGGSLVQGEFLAVLGGRDAADPLDTANSLDTADPLDTSGSPRDDRAPGDGR